MKILRADEIEALPEAFEHHRQSFGNGRMSVIIVLPDGSGFRATATDDEETVYSERLTEAEMVAVLMQHYGLIALKVQ